MRLCGEVHVGCSVHKIRIGRAVSHNERFLVDRIPAVLELCICRAEHAVFDKKKSHVYLVGKGFWGARKKSRKVADALHVPPLHEIKGFGTHGLDAWEKLRSGSTKLMQKYPVQICGYCPEVQVGPKGHRVRQCQALKHQMRDGQHGWQKATIDDLVPPVYVYHIRDRSMPPLDSLKRYYGKLPAVVNCLHKLLQRIDER
ncbi:hypothetical protein Leryth_018199 [Lithospermum erythrorhizon]|nr:hypothetical protein Leryth_018199 [Lithospermum erythrorhizon]